MLVVKHYTSSVKTNFFLGGWSSWLFTVNKGVHFSAVEVDHVDRYIHLFIYLHFIYSKQQLITYCNRFFWKKQTNICNCFL